MSLESSEVSIIIYTQAEKHRANTVEDNEDSVYDKIRGVMSLTKLLELGYGYQEDTSEVTCSLCQSGVDRMKYSNGRPPWRSG